MKLTHQAAAHASNLMRKKNEGEYDKGLTIHSELYTAEFWEMTMTYAESAAHAQHILEALSQLGAEGATYSPQIAIKVEEAMKLARRTLRNEELKRWNRQKR